MRDRGVFSAGILSLLMTGVLAFGTEALAIDQVTLTNGQIIEGTVLEEVPGQYVDLRLINGQSRRFDLSEISGVERNLPPAPDRPVLESASKAWISLLVGGYLNLSSFTGSPGVSGDGVSMLPYFGLKLGLNLSPGDSGRFALAFSYDYVADPNALNVPNFLPARSYHDLNFQLLLTKIGGGGFYLGPTAGLAIVPSVLSPFATNATPMSYFELGAVGGYDLQVSKSFTIGPDVRFQHLFTSQVNIVKFAFQAGFHF